MTITLPPGSTSADLQAAINSADSGDTIIISSDMPFSGMVTVPAGKEITIQSDGSNNWVMSVPGSKVRHFSLNGDLILQSITLDGANIGGGVVMTSGSLTMNDGAVIQNCTSGVSGGGINAKNGSLIVNKGAVIQKCYSSASGGAAYVNPNGTIVINGGVIRDNTAAAAGGGIMFQESIFNMTEGEFLRNKASASGGAIQTLGNNTITISGGIISGNTSGFQGGGIGIPVNTNADISGVIISGNSASYNGGGIFVQGTAIMSNVTISGNKADRLGGGIYSYAYGKTEISGESYIVNNNAPNGGGIYTVASTYNNLVTGSETIFQCNWATTAYQPPLDAGTLYPDIQFAGTSITDHPLNNFDINYNVGEPIDVYSNITYDANGGVGSHTGPDIIPGRTDTVLSSVATGISRSDYIFTSWNTEPDGSGIPYAPGEELTVGCSMVLFAQWVVGPALLTINYNSNGGRGSYSDRRKEPGTNYTILSSVATGISYPPLIFARWNTAPDGSGIFYAPGDIILITEDITLYAQWTEERECIIAYDCNGGIGHYEDRCKEFEVNYIVLSTSQTGISRTGSIFTVWNTESDGSGISFASGAIIAVNRNMTLYAQWQEISEPKRLCRAPAMKCRKAIEGQKIWVDDDNANDKRPPSAEILLRRDGEVYKRVNVDSAGDGYFGFCCLPIWKNSRQKYIYTIDETEVLGYTKTIEGYNVINTLEP